MLTAVGVGATVGVVACLARPWLAVAVNVAALVQEAALYQPAAPGER
jgi:hypothetical protein